MAKRIIQIRNIVKSFEDIFDNSVIDNINYVGKQNKAQIFFPYVPMGVKKSGLALKDKVGYVSIEETYTDDVVSYVYRFSTDEYSYLFCRETENDKYDEGMYSFHYDMVENDKPHPPHITTFLPAIRHISRKITLEEFLGFIRDHFFIRHQGSYVRKNGNLWDNNFV